MKFILAAALTLASLLALPVSAATEVEATLALPHDHVLPGIPFDMVVTFTNVSNRPVTVGGADATLIVTFANGETSVLDSPCIRLRATTHTSSRSARSTGATGTTSRLCSAAERFTESPAHPYLLKAAADCALSEALTAARP